MTTEAELESTPAGIVPKGPGWFVVNAKEAVWMKSDRFGSFVRFEGQERFKQMGVNIHVLNPGQPACMYHSEALEEAFLVLNGRCTLVVEGEERELGPWDFFFAAPGTTHVFVGAGDGPCAILMMGARGDDHGLNYPPDPAAAKHGACTDEATPDPRVAYAGVNRPELLPYAETERTLDA